MNKFLNTTLKILAILFLTQALAMMLFPSWRMRFTASPEKPLTQLQDQLPDPATEIEAHDKLTIMVINSNPSGANIFLNDIDIHKVTPARISVPATGKFSLTLKHDKYMDYNNSDLDFETTGRTFKATLIKK